MVVILLLVPSSSSLITSTTPTFTQSVSSGQQVKYHLVNSTQQQQSPPRPPLPTNYCYGARPFKQHQQQHNHHHNHQSESITTSPDANKSNRPNNYSREFVNHVTRINISNDFSQAQASANGEPEAVVKEGKLI